MQKMKDIDIQIQLFGEENLGQKKFGLYRESYIRFYIDIKLYSFEMNLVILIFESQSWSNDI